MDRIVTRTDSYFDSVQLMALSAELGRLPGLEAGHVLLGTPANRELLAAAGFDAAALAALGPTNLCIALRAPEAATLDRALDLVEQRLRAGAQPSPGAPTAERPVGLEGGLAAMPGAKLALISVPGAYAAREAARALERGLHVMIFSDNVSVEQELALKRRAAERGLLVMGPDCGTACIGGMPLGFANRVRRGDIGLVGASGTGLQEIACQIHRRGGGVSHAIGTGGRDLSAAVGGLTTLAALELLAADPATRVLVVVSKPPAPEVAAEVTARLAAIARPAVTCFLGAPSAAPMSAATADAERPGSCHVARTLDEAARLACQLAAGQTPTPLAEDAGNHDPAAIARTLRPEQRLLHGLFCGGTLGGETLRLLREHLHPVTSNLDHDDDASVVAGHSVTDLGDDAYTSGRPHPMIEPVLRGEHILRLGGAPETAVLLLNLVLGSGSHADPAGVTAAAVVEARAANPTLVVVAAITGTELDRQDLAAQSAALQQAGALLAPSNAAAARLAARITLAQDHRQAQEVQR